MTDKNALQLFANHRGQCVPQALLDEVAQLTQERDAAMQMFAVLVHHAGGTLIVHDADIAALKPGWTLVRTDALDGRSILFRLRYDD